MNARLTSPNKLLAALAAGSMVFTACFNDPSSPETSSTGGAYLEGQVTGEVSLAKRMAMTGKGLEGAAVTVVRLKADGSLETVSKAEVKTGVDGRFLIESSVEAAHGLIVTAKKDGKEFKAVVSGEVKKGKKTLCPPLTVETSVEAEVYAKVQQDGKGGMVSFADIAAHVDAAVAAKARGKAEMTAFVAAQLETEAEVRSKTLIEGTAKVTHAQIEKADDFRLKAQAALEASLDAASRTEAGVTVDVKAKAEGECAKSQFQGIVEAGIALNEWAKAQEAAFRAEIKAHAEAAVEAEAKLVWMKSIALRNALSLEASLSEEAKASNDKLTAVSDAAASLKLALESAKTQIEIDAAFAACRNTVAVAFKGGFTLNGSVEGNPAGVKIELAQVKPDGKIEIVSGAVIETGVDGKFSIKTEIPLPDNAVVVVTKDSTTLTALVDAKVDSVKVGAETTVETDLLKKALESGKVEVTPADVKAQVDSTVAAGIKGNDSLMVALLATLDAGAKAQAKFLTDSGVGLAQAGLVLLTSARSTAQAKLEGDLRAAAGEGAKIKAAYDAYHEAVMEAYVKAGLDASAYARSMQVYAQAMVKVSLGLSSEARMALLRSAHSQAARGLRSAMEIQMKASGASEAVLKAVVEAGVALQASVDASAKVETIEAAYATYHASIVASLKGVFLLSAQRVGEADATLRKEGGARAALMAAILAEAASEGISKAHVEFAGRVEAEVKGSFEGGLGGPTAAQVKVITQVLLLANMCG